ncbi:WD40-repeat-containing domain protein [Tirmania nivea]|nr:WD40-repeat-containing domain protein [Tirmania nivea]
MTSLEDAPLRNSKLTLFLDEPPACILIAPSDPSLVVIGTYLYDTENGTKSGSLRLYRKSADNLNLHDTHAILDAKFSPHDPDYLATAQTHGCFQTFRLDRNADPPSLVNKRTISLFDPESILLSLIWNPMDPSLIACTLSTGGVAIINSDLPKNNVGYSYEPHSDQAWTCEYSPGGRILYSGADDSVLNAQDLETQQMVWKDRTTHGAGVTAIMARPDNFTLLTGSYDDNLRIIDLRTRRVVGQINLGGGVWRLGKRGTDGRSVIASCMYVGSRLVGFGEDLRTPSVVARFEEHESMNYACDIHPMDPDIVVSCSFYDQRVCIWDIKN